jgi:hypothetical protein
VMAAEQVISKLQKSTETVTHTAHVAHTVTSSRNEILKKENLELLSEAAKSRTGIEDLVPISRTPPARQASSGTGTVDSTIPKSSGSFGLSPADAAGLVEISTRIQAMLHSTNLADSDYL